MEIKPAYNNGYYSSGQKFKLKNVSLKHKNKHS